MVPLGGGGVGDPWVEAVDKADDEVTGSVCDVDAFMEEVSGGEECLRESWSRVGFGLSLRTVVWHPFSVCWR